MDFLDKLPHMKGISLFYQILQDKISFTKSNSQFKWEWDLETSFTDDQWVAALNAPFKASKSASLWELSYKIAFRWYRTPHLLHMIDKSLSLLCWRDCGSHGTLIHILWSCNALSNYWFNTFQLIQNVNTPKSFHHLS